MTIHIPRGKGTKEWEGQRIEGNVESSFIERYLLFSCIYKSAFNTKLSRYSIKQKEEIVRIIKLPFN